jgi:hypothetical protein
MIPLLEKKRDFSPQPSPMLVEKSPFPPWSLWFVLYNFNLIDEPPGQILQKFSRAEIFRRGQVGLSRPSRNPKPAKESQAPRKGMRREAGGFESLYQLDVIHGA